MNGRPGIVVIDASDTIQAVTGLDFDASVITAMYTVVNPEKLAHANRTS